MPCKNLPTKPGLYIWFHGGLYQPIYVYISTHGTPFIDFNGTFLYLDYLGGTIFGGPYATMEELNKDMPKPIKHKLTLRFLNWILSKLP